MKSTRWTEQPVKAIIALIVPLKSAENQHLEILSKVAQKLTKPEFQLVLLTSKDKKVIIKALDIDINDNDAFDDKVTSDEVKKCQKIIKIL